MAFVKSGFLHRQSTILRRWKKNWFDLWSDGCLVFYNDQQRREMEDEIHMQADCINIRSASASRDLTPPEGKCREALFQIVCRDGRVISLCADSRDDALAWTLALQDARNSTVYYPDQYASNAVHSAGGHVYAFVHNQGVYPTQQVNHVIIEEHRRDDGQGIALGLLTGAATGLAIGSLFSVF